MSISILVFLILIYAAVSLRVLKQYERGVVFLLGKFAGVRGPGLTLIFVPIQQMMRVSLRTVTMQIPSQKIITKDNVSIDIAAVAYYHITDPEKAVIAIENVYNAINQISQTTVRNVVGRFSLDQLLSDTASINDQIKNVIDPHTEPWGTQVTAVEIKDITLPDNMQRAMAKEAEAERERRAKIVAAEGEYQAAVKLGQAADIITAASGGAAAAHPADDGGNLDREEFHHHLPRAVHDDRAGGDRAVVKGSRRRNSDGALVIPIRRAMPELPDRCNLADGKHAPRAVRTCLLPDAPQYLLTSASPRSGGAPANGISNRPTSATTASNAQASLALIANAALSTRGRT